MKTSTALAILLPLAAASTPTLLHAADPLRSYHAEIIAKAKPDECFYGIYDPEVPGSGENLYVKEGLPDDDGSSPDALIDDCEDCIADSGVPKTNQSYVWGMVRKDDYLWWGTGPNVNRLVAGTYFGTEDSGISRSDSRGIDFSVVEYGKSKFARDGVYDGATQMGPPVDPAFGDWRPPDIFRYNLDTDTLERLDLQIEAADPAAWTLLWKTVGLRSAGYTAPITGFPEGLVILAGPTLTATEGGDGIAMFAFDASDGSFVAAGNFPAYSNIRKWKFHDGQLYTAVATDTGTGEVLRWEKENATVSDPLVFQTVGTLPSGGAELEVHDDGDGPRLFVNTWPGIEGNLDIGGDIDAVLDLINAPAGLFRGPVIPAGGLNGSHTNSWNLVWSVTEYEPDLVLALHYGGGAMASFDGQLYWGTMHVPGTASRAHTIGYGPPDPIMPRPDPYPTDPEDPDRVAYEQDVARFQAETRADFFNSYRAISIWRGEDFTSSGGDIELLYGQSDLPVRLERTQFTGTPRGQLSAFKWGLFFEANVGDLRNVSDGESVPTFFGGTSETLADGGDWDTIPNTSGYTPLYGPEGIQPDVFPTGLFGFNNYTWTMQVFGGKLYIGTMDWDDIASPDETDGAHLYCIPSATEPASRVTARGMANWSSYGIRTIAADETRGELYLGMANVQNLLNPKVGDPATGGWEVQRVSLRYTDDDFDEMDDAWETTVFGSTAAKDDPDVSSDADPQSDWQEWLAGTDPNDARSFFFTAEGPAGTPGMREIEWATVPDRYYTVFESDDLAGDWAPAATYHTIGAAGAGTLQHAYDPAASDAKFFRVTVSLNPPPAP